MDTRARFEFVEGATSDLSFVARGPSLDSVFLAAGQAFLAATLEAPESVARRIRRWVVLEEPDLELLFIQFINEMVYLLDAENLLMRVESVEIDPGPPPQLRAELAGEPIDRRRHVLTSDIKAATAHGLRVAKTAEGWMASATLDV